MRVWLMKSEPDVFSIDDLRNSPQRTAGWEGVRNYQARNYMRDEMRKGDPVLFYHSSCPVPGIAGLAEVARESHPDPTALDSQSPYFDPRASEEEPRWFMVSVRFQRKFSEIIPLSRLREIPDLAEMPLLQRGQRLSIQPVTPEQYEVILKVADCGT